MNMRTRTNGIDEETEMSDILLATVSTIDGVIDGEAWLKDAIDEALQIIDREPADLLDEWDDGSLIIETEDCDSYPGMSDRIIRYLVDEGDLEAFRSSVEDALSALSNGDDDDENAEDCPSHVVSDKTAESEPFSPGYLASSVGDIYYGKRLVVRDDTEVYYPLKDEVGDARTYEDIADRLKDRPLVWETNPNGHSAWLDVKSCPERENELGKVRDGKILCAALINDDGFVTAKSLSALDELLRGKKSLDTMYSDLAFLKPVWEVEKEEEYFVVTDTYTERHWAWVDLTDWEAFDQRHTPNGSVRADTKGSAK